MKLKDAKAMMRKKKNKINESAGPNAQSARFEGDSEEGAIFLSPEVKNDPRIVTSDTSISEGTGDQVKIEEAGEKKMADKYDIAKLRLLQDGKLSGKELTAAMAELDRKRDADEQLTEDGSTVGDVTYSRAVMAVKKYGNRMVERILAIVIEEVGDVTVEELYITGHGQIRAVPDTDDGDTYIDITSEMDRCIKGIFDAMLESSESTDTLMTPDQVSESGEEFNAYRYLVSKHGKKKANKIVNEYEEDNDLNGRDRLLSSRDAEEVEDLLESLMPPDQGQLNEKKQKVLSKEEQGSGKTIGKDGRLAVIQSTETGADEVYMDTKYNKKISQAELKRILKKAPTLASGEKMQVNEYGNSNKFYMKYEDLFHGYHAIKVNGKVAIRSTHDGSKKNNVNPDN